MLYVPPFVVKSLTLQTNIAAILGDVGAVLCAAALLGMGWVVARFSSIPAAEVLLHTLRRRNKRQQNNEAPEESDVDPATLAAAADSTPIFR